MKIYHVQDSYVEYLRKYDSKVLMNKDNKRPYVGVVMNVNGSKYYVPLSSPKPKHIKMKNGKDFHKIKQGEYGAINFNLMIPVEDKNIILYDISKELDDKYRQLLQHQFSEIVQISEVIKNKANKLYELCVLKSEEDLSNKDLEIKNRCVDFKLLEEQCKTYNSNID